MAELLMWKKRVRAGHRSSATKTIGQVHEALLEAELNISFLKQKKAALEEKMKLLRFLTHRCSKK